MKMVLFGQRACFYADAESLYPLPDLSHQNYNPLKPRLTA
jgi:hypothetical protein